MRILRRSRTVPKRSLLEGSASALGSLLLGEPCSARLFFGPERCLAKSAARKVSSLWSVSFRVIEGMLREIEIEMRGQDRHTGFRLDQGIMFGLLVLGFLFRCADNDLRAE